MRFWSVTTTTPTGETQRRCAHSPVTSTEAPQCTDTLLKAELPNIRFPNREVTISTTTTYILIETYSGGKRENSKNVYCDCGSGEVSPRGSCADIPIGAAAALETGTQSHHRWHRHTRQTGAWAQSGGRGLTAEPSGSSPPALAGTRKCSSSSSRNGRLLRCLHLEALTELMKYSLRPPFCLSV